MKSCRFTTTSGPGFWGRKKSQKSHGGIFAASHGNRSPGGWRRDAVTARRGSQGRMAEWNIVEGPGPVNALPNGPSVDFRSGRPPECRARREPRGGSRRAAAPGGHIPPDHFGGMRGEDTSRAPTGPTPAAAGFRTMQTRGALAR